MPGNMGNVTIPSANVSIYSIGEVAKFYCSEGYVLSGENTLMCLQNGTWSAKPPICEKGELELTCGRDINANLMKPILFPKFYLVKFSST